MGTESAAPPPSRLSTVHRPLRTVSPPEIHPTVRQFIQDAGALTQSFGLGRVAGQVYALLYFSPAVRSLSDLQLTLGISKGSASMVVRQLEQWGAVRKVWVRGDRKDYYEANTWLGQIVKNVVVDVLGSKLVALAPYIQDHDDASSSGEGGEFIRSRVEHLQEFQAHAQRLWENPLVQRLLK